MKQGVKGAGKFIIISVALLVAATVTSAQFARKDRVKKSEVPAFGTFYSLTLDQPPFPFNPFPGLPVYALTNGAYVYDDRTVDYPALRAEQSASLASAQSLSLTEGEGGGAMMMLMGGSGNTNLALSIPVIQGTNVEMTIANANPEEPYDLFSTSTIGTTNPWAYLGRLAAGVTNFSVPLLSISQAQVVSFNAADTADSDGDSLPDALEVLSTQTDPNSPDDTNSVPPNSVAADLLKDVSADLYVKSYDRIYSDIGFFLEGVTIGWGGTQSWVRGIGGAGAGYEVWTEPPVTTNWNNLVTWNGLGAPSPSGEFMPPEIWHYKRWHEVVTSPPNDPNSFTSYLDDDMTTGMELHTGGRALSSRQSLFVFYPVAKDVVPQPGGGQTLVTIPASDLTLLGEHPDVSGRVWKTLADNQKIDATPAATIQHTNYQFTLSQSKLKLKIMRGGQDIAGKKQIVWVGQPIGMTCELSHPGFGLSNITWTVPGNTISNYVYNSTNAQVVSQYPKTNASVGYYWIQDLAAGDVTVTAQLNGFTMEAQAQFEVRRPDATFRLTPKWYVEVSSIFNGAYAGVYPRLHTGRNISTNDVGMMFEFILNDLKGYQGSYEFQFVQLVTSDLKLNLPYTSGLYISKEVQMRGLDGRYPYASWGSPKVYGYDTDTPSYVLIGDLSVFVYNQDQFESYLMFRPSGGIPVPLRISNWEWKGKAQFNGANGTWTGLTPYVNPQGSIAADTIAYPTWTNNIGNYSQFFRYNNFWFVP